MMVYIYTFPNGKKYVGQTAQTLEMRAKQGEGYVNSPAVYNAIKKYGWSSLVIETFPCSSKQEMNDLERYYIKLYNTTNSQYGYNLTIGGEGVPRLNRTLICNLWNKGLTIGEIADEMKCATTSVVNILQSENLYDKLEVKKRTSRKLSETSGEKLKQYYSIPENHQKRIQNGLKGAKTRSKPVVVYKDKERTQLIGIFESGRQCAKALNIDHSLPSYALKHNHYSSGYYFYFLKDLDIDYE